MSPSPSGFIITYIPTKLQWIFHQFLSGQTHRQTHTDRHTDATKTIPASHSITAWCADNSGSYWNHAAGDTWPRINLTQITFHPDRARQSKSLRLARTRLRTDSSSPRSTPASAAATTSRRDHQSNNRSSLTHSIANDARWWHFYCLRSINVIERTQWRNAFCRSSAARWSWERGLVLLPRRLCGH